MNHKDFLDFNSARKTIHSLKLRSAQQWREYIKHNKINNIPSGPEKFYKDKGWISWMDWLGYSYDYEGYRNRKYFVNKNYFQNWSPNMAYILGLWWTDGNIFDSRFNISQHMNESYLLKEILNDMNATHVIATQKNLCRIDIYCTEIVRDIKKLGGIEKKSKKISFPSVPHEYLPDFIRGLWDGDGSIWKTSSGSCRSNIASGSYKFIYGLKKILSQNINNFHCKIYINHYKKGYEINGVKCKNPITAYKMVLGINDTIRLRNLMYSTISDKSIKNNKKFLLFKEAGELKILRREKSQMYLSFKRARKFVRKLNLASSNDYVQYFLDKKISFLPENPRKLYKYNGWVSWRDFLGTQILNYNDAKIQVKKLNLKSISEWMDYIKSPNKSPVLPSDPAKYYRNKGWMGWYSWLNKNKKYTTKKTEGNKVKYLYEK